jgi:TonB family protein
VSTTSARLTWEMGASLGLHAGALGIVLIAQQCAPSTPLFKPEDVMIVQAVALPKSVNDWLPDKPMHRPDPPKGEVADSPEVVPPTASDMVLEDEQAPQPKGEKSREAERDQLLAQARKEELLRDLSTPEGPENQVQTDPDGVDPREAILGIGIGINDPALARWQAACRDKILPNWTPLPAVVAAHPNYVVQLVVRVSATGAMSEPEVYQSSGDPSFDQTALRAIYKTATIVPPPAEYAESAAKGVVITLAAKDKQ